MTNNRTQQMVFCEDALPALFHHSPRQFLSFLQRDGNKFLHFYWNQVGKNLKIPKLADPFGLNFLIRRPNKEQTIVIILLPVPRVAGEAYLMGLVYRQSGMIPFFRIQQKTRVFALVAEDIETGNGKTKVIERKRNGQLLFMGAGPDPVAEAFYQYLLKGDPALPIVP